MTTKTTSRIRGGAGGGEKGEKGISDGNGDNDDDDAIVVVTPESSTPHGYPATTATDIATSTAAAAAAPMTTTSIESDNKISEENGERMKMKEPFSWTQLRQTLFPIYGDEVTKFLLISSIKFFIIVVLTFTRDTKDTLIVTQCGAEAIAFLKVSQVPVLSNGIQFTYL